MNMRVEGQVVSMLIWGGWVRGVGRTFRGIWQVQRCLLSRRGMYAMIMRKVFNLECSRIRLVTRTIPFSAAQANGVSTSATRMFARVQSENADMDIWTDVPSSRTMTVVLGTLANSFLTRSVNVYVNT